MFIILKFKYGRKTAQTYRVDLISSITVEKIFCNNGMIVVGSNMSHIFRPVMDLWVILKVNSNDSLISKTSEFSLKP